MIRNSLDAIPCVQGAGCRVQGAGCRAQTSSRGIHVDGTPRTGDRPVLLPHRFMAAKEKGARRRLQYAAACQAS
ncbi:hypothetical protein FU139_02450 [Burkholderia territorii]|nr:hypothetical protein FU139_02450 [Burkholderia territorii]